MSDFRHFTQFFCSHNLYLQHGVTAHHVFRVGGLQHGTKRNKGRGHFNRRVLHRFITAYNVN